MKKEKYLKPTCKVLALDYKTSLLYPSGQNETISIGDDDEDAGSKSYNGGIWDNMKE